MTIKNNNKRRCNTSRRVLSFSVPDGDLTSHENIVKLKEHCKKTGKNFSFLVLKGVEQQIQELGL